MARRAPLALVAAAMALALAACGDRDDPLAYTEERRAEFLAGCERDAPAEVCRCTWDRIEATIPVERFVAASEAVVDGADAPPELAEIAAACATASVFGEPAP